MMNILAKSYLSALLLMFNLSLWSQSADVVRGCPDLQVQFSGPAQSNYFWDFRDGTSSELQDPQHIFRSAGNYAVTLYDTEGGTETGQVLITIYSKPTVSIEVSPEIGCIPLVVSFSSELIIDSGITIEQLQWTFGDGGTAIGANVIHRYTTVNVFDLSIELETELPNCNNTFFFEDEVTTQDANPMFSSDKNAECTLPAIFTFSNGDDPASGSTYSWNFGNGQSASDINPAPVSYTSEGKYYITLTTTTSSGCMGSITDSIIVGPPIIDVEIPDTLCLNAKYDVTNNTIAESVEWSFGNPLIRTRKKNPTLLFTEPGNQEVRLRASNSEDCFVDAVFPVFVDDPQIDFSLEPTEFCAGDPKFLIANDDTHLEYIWNGDNSSGSVFELPVIPERDSLYINRADTIKATLMIMSSAGCLDTIEKFFSFQLAEAYMLPNTTLGIEALSVTFFDLSISDNDIVRRFWDYGDGNTSELDPSITEHTYVYENCGIFYPRLLIEDVLGCVDVSKTIEIEVLCEGDDPIGGGSGGVPGSGSAGGGTGTPTGPICAPLEFSIEFNPEAIDFHLDGYGGLVDHCWTAGELNYTFDRPGVHPLTMISEFKGLLLDTLFEREITLVGTKAFIEHSMDCSDPYTYNFSSTSLNADEWAWSYRGEIISTAATFDYTFTEAGDHQVTLATTNSADGCPPDEVSVDLYIREPEASFEIPAKMCDNEFYDLNASQSKDVFASCYKGYLWEFENQRPRETGQTQLEHSFSKGRQTVTLTVEDINGCTATTSRTTVVYGIEPDFNLDSTTCLPYTKQLLDLSITDTTLVAWDWDFGSQEQNPFQEFTAADLDPDRQDTLSITMAVEDAFGCKDTIEKFITIQEPNFFIATNVGSRVCLEEPILFTVLDTVGIYDEYEYEWTFGESEPMTGDSLSIAFDSDGRQEVILTYRHKNGGCEGTAQQAILVFPTPIVEFSSDKDGEAFICPGQVAFFSDPDLAGQGFNFDWSFGDETFSTLQNPVIVFDIGTHTINLVVSNDRGCQDSLSKTLVVVGPRATITADKDAICGEEEVTFTISDLTNVKEFSVDLGDGVIVDNETSIVHTYQERPTVVTLLMESEEGCTVSDTLPIIISDVEANFEFACGGGVLNNLSVAGTEFLWDFGNGQTSTEENPEFPSELLDGNNIVSLTVIDGTTGCVATFSSSSSSQPAFEMANLFSPNGDGRNDKFFPVNVVADREEIIVRTFKIYNRWGQLVYDNDSPDGWGGFYEGGLAPPEVYAYFIELEIDGCGETTQKGNVTLIR